MYDKKMEPQNVRCFTDAYMVFLTDSHIYKFRCAECRSICVTLTSDPAIGCPGDGSLATGGGFSLASGALVGVGKSHDFTSLSCSWKN